MLQNHIQYSVYKTLYKLNGMFLKIICTVHLITQGAPESVLERCRWIRVGGGSRVPMTSDLREQLLSTVREWSSGRDTLRCLAMATRDSPPDPRTLNLENSATFVEYEVTFKDLVTIHK